MFYIQLPPSDSIHKWTLAQQEGRFQNGVEPGHWGGHYKCLAVKPMWQIMFYNQLPTSDTDVETGHCGRHQVSGHGTDLSNHVL